MIVIVGGIKSNSLKVTETFFSDVICVPSETKYALNKNSQVHQGIRLKLNI
ncbi:MAG: hypothetical protein LBU14_02735 [Candidatus Peribacteria bacterium]|nr:hypothetical protein [Candidatus Peribacteria bacterium]